MRPLLRRWSGVCIAAALVLPLGAMLFLGSPPAQGQFRPPLRPPVMPRPPIVMPNPNPNPIRQPAFPQPNNFNPNPAQPMMPQANNLNPQPIRPLIPPTQPMPTLVRVWYCKSCGHELGRGDIAPNLTSCPHCGAGSRPYTASTPPSSSSSSSSSGGDDDSSSVPYILGGIAGGALLLALGITLFVKLSNNMAQDNDRDPYRFKKRRRRD